VKPYKITASRLRPDHVNLPGGPLPLGWFAISTEIEEDVAVRRAGTGKWWRIKSEKGVIYRTLRFSSIRDLIQDPETNNRKIVLDYDAWVSLYGGAENLDLPLNLEIRRINRLIAFWALYTHPDPAVRIAAWLGYISVALGLLGFILGIYSVFK
jgi:hypothetical protein